MPLWVPPQVLQAVMSQYGIPPASFAPVCVVVDKVRKSENEPQNPKTL